MKLSVFLLLCAMAQGQTKPILRCETVPRQFDFCPQPPIAGEMRFKVYIFYGDAWHELDGPVASISTGGPDKPVDVPTSGAHVPGEMISTTTGSGRRLGLKALDVAAIQETRHNPASDYACGGDPGGDGHGNVFSVCVPAPETIKVWTCEKGSHRILMQDIDGDYHCVKFPAEALKGKEK